MKQSLNHLAVFDAVARAGSITKAAENLSMSQPNVTRQIKTLERSLGVTLFERVGRGVRMTRQARVLAEYTFQIFALVEEADAALSELQTMRRGMLTIGAGTTVGVYLLPAALVLFRKKYPKIELRLEVGNSASLLNRLQEGAIDFALTEVLNSASQFESTIFMNDELVAIFPPKHRLAGRKSLRLEEIADEPFVVREGVSETHSLVQRVFAEKGLNIRPVIALSSTEAVKRAVASGLGVSIVSKLGVETESKAGNLAVVTLRDVPLRRPIFLIKRKGRQPDQLANAFLEILGEFVNARNSTHPINSRTPPARK